MTAPFSTDNSSPAPHAQRISDYLQRKQRLIDQANAGFAPVVRAFLSDLCADLRQCRPHMADALLVEMFLSGVGIEDETTARGQATCQHYREYFGLAVRRHDVRLSGDDATVTLELGMHNALHRVIAESLGEAVPLTLRVRLTSADNDAHDIALVDAGRLDLADLEPLCAALNGYWAACLEAGALAPPNAA